MCDKYFVLNSVYICVKVIWQGAVVLVTVVPGVGQPPVRPWGWATTPCTPPPPMAVQEAMGSLEVLATCYTGNLFMNSALVHKWIDN